MLPVALDRLFRYGVERDTRNGKVLQLTGPTLLQFERPMERVMFWPQRDSNPFFHMAESLWMLAGRDDVEFVANYAKQMRAYSDDGVSLNGAYGFRWRKWFGYDQIELIIKNLKANKDCRRQVLGMWDATANQDFDLDSDLQKTTCSNDVPCNTHTYFAINHAGRLDMTVCNRSNDLVWGCLGANAVHFSFLQEYMAVRIGVEVGSYFQFTNNLHGYLATIEPLRDLVMEQAEFSPYQHFSDTKASVMPLNAEELVQFDEDLQCLDKQGGFASSYFNTVYLPMRQAHQNHKAGNQELALKWADGITAPDWRLACKEWLQRRYTKLKKAQDDGVAYEAK